MPAAIASRATSVAVNLLTATRCASRARLVAISLSDERASANALASIEVPTSSNDRTGVRITVILRHGYDSAGSALNGHADTSESSEFAANRFAARLLIDDREYEAAESMSDSPLFIAQELGVTLAIVQAYRPQRVLARPTSMRTDA